MVNIKLTKDELARKLLPSYIEELYIDFTYELLKYAKTISKKDLNNKKIEDIEEKQKNTSYGIYPKEFIDNLSFQKSLINEQNKQLSEKLETSLNTMLSLFKEILDGHSINDYLPQKFILQTKYTDKEISLIESYVELRKNSYKTIEYVGYYIIKKEIPKGTLDSELFAIAIKSLKGFDLDSILRYRKNISEINILMDIINKFYMTYEIDSEKLREIKKPLEDTEYIDIIDTLSTTYIKTFKRN